ncbi:MAG: hypothetical protein U1E33_04385 [Rhodospirillales bacterium]
MASIEVDSGFGKAPAIDLPAVFFIVGVILCGFAAAMPPALVDVLEANTHDYRVFLVCAAISMFVGLSTALSFRRHRVMPWASAR